MRRVLATALYMLLSIGAARAWLDVPPSAVPLTQRSAGTNRSASVSTTAANLWPANQARQGGWIKNDDVADIWCNYDTAATVGAGGGNFRVAANGGAYNTEASFVSTNALSCVSAQTVSITSREF